jgi:glycosyltransferase involved in cell wall biosynthesis
VSKSQPRVSVVIPAYNAAVLLPKSIESVLSQTRPPFEILVVDDGSADNTRAVVSSYPEPVQYLYKSNGGASSAKNHGIVRATGDWVAFLDADDWWEPQKLERQINDFQGDAEIGLSFTNYYVEHFRAGRQLNTPIDPARIWPDLRETNLVSSPTVMVRRDVFEKVGLFREDLKTCEDWDLWLRIGLKYRFRYLPEALSHYRVAEVSLSSSSKRMLDYARILLDDGSLLQGLQGQERWWQGRRTWARQLHHAAIIERERRNPEWIRLALQSIAHVPFGSGFPNRWKFLLAGLKNMALKKD